MNSFYDKKSITILVFICVIFTLSKASITGGYGYFTVRSFDPSFSYYDENTQKWQLNPSELANLTNWMKLTEFILCNSRPNFATGLREFQFYDIFYNYSHPTSPSNGTVWQSQTALTILKYSPEISAGTLQAYTSAIRQNGGRSWLYVQSIADEQRDLDQPGEGGYPKLLWPNCNVDCDLCPRPEDAGFSLFVMYRPSAAWAQRIVPIWAPFAKEMGFDGIHFDQLGSLGYSGSDFTDLAQDFNEFLFEASSILRTEYNLAMSFNFVDSFAWNASLYTSGTIEFPYWEVWTLPDVEDLFFSTMANMGTYGAFAEYPRKDGGGNPLNPLLPECANSCQGMIDPEGNGLLPNAYCPCNEMGLVEGRWKKALANSQNYIIFGDVGYRLTTEYFTGDMRVEAQLQHDLFGN